MAHTVTTRIGTYVDPEFPASTPSNASHLENQGVILSIEFSVLKLVSNLKRSIRIN